MEQMVLEAGVEAAKLWRIPIGIDLACFPGRSEEARRAARRRAALPETAVVVGSFQKDGVGWGEGLEPKLIKGPDVLVAALSALKRQVPELHVLLTGPARGYVKAGLERAAIPFTHLLLSDYADLCMAFHALDAYLISSRDEGGPKALLEAMASGVPVVTTRVGQAIDLARPDENAIVVESEDVEGLVTGATRLLADTDLKNRIVLEGRATAEANSHSAQTPLWAKFFEGYVGAVIDTLGSCHLSDPTFAQIHPIPQTLVRWRQRGVLHDADYRKIHRFDGSMGMYRARVSGSTVTSARLTWVRLSLP